MATRRTVSRNVPITIVAHQSGKRKVGKVIRIPVSSPLPITELNVPGFAGYGIVPQLGEALIIVLSASRNVADLVDLVLNVGEIRWCSTVNVKWAHKFLSLHPDKWRGILVYLPKSLDNMPIGDLTAHYWVYDSGRLHLQVLAIPLKE